MNAIHDLAFKTAKDIEPEDITDFRKFPREQLAEYERTLTAGWGSSAGQMREAIVVQANRVRAEIARRNQIERDQSSTEKADARYAADWKLREDALQVSRDALAVSRKSVRTARISASVSFLGLVVAAYVAWAKNIEADAKVKKVESRIEALEAAAKMPPIPPK